MWDLKKELVIPSTEKFKASFLSNRRYKTDRIWLDWG